jgi:hypothetical protein
MHGLHDVQLLQKLRTARRDVQRLLVIGELTLLKVGKRHNSRCRYNSRGRPCGPTDRIPCKAESAWSESFKRSPVTPPRGFSFVAIRRGKTMLLVYSVHFKSNRGEAYK